MRTIGCLPFCLMLVAPREVVVNDPALNHLSAFPRPPPPLQAKIARFWLPRNNAGEDIMLMAIRVKSRVCTKMVLDAVINAKTQGTLASLPHKGDRFLRNILLMSREFDDLVARFLKDYYLDDASAEVGSGCTQLHLTSGWSGRSSQLLRACCWMILSFITPLCGPPSGQGQLSGPLAAKSWSQKSSGRGSGTKVRAIDTLLQPSSIRLQRLSNTSLHSLSPTSPPSPEGQIAAISEAETGRTTRMVARYVRIPNVAGLIARPSEQEAQTATDTSEAAAIAKLAGSAVHTFVRQRNAQLFGNSIMRMTLQHKWTTYAKDMFMANLSLFALKLGTFTIFTLCLAQISASTEAWDLVTDMTIGLPRYGGEWREEKEEDWAQSTTSPWSPGRPQLSAGGGGHSAGPAPSQECPDAVAPIHAAAQHSRLRGGEGLQQMTCKIQPHLACFLRRTGC